MKLERSIEKLIGGDFYDKAAKALEDGHKDLPYLNDSTEEFSQDTAQIGGVFIVGPGNTCEYSYRSQYGGDTPDLNDLLQFAKVSTKDYSKEYIGNNEVEHEDDLEVDESSNIFVNPRTQGWIEKLKMNSRIASPKKNTENTNIDTHIKKKKENIIERLTSNWDIIFAVMLVVASVGVNVVA